MNICFYQYVRLLKLIYILYIFLNWKSYGIMVLFERYHVVLKYYEIHMWVCNFNLKKIIIQIETHIEYIFLNFFKRYIYYIKKREKTIDNYAIL